MSKRILIVSPHTDDGEFGCGGSIAKFVEEGNDIYYVAFSTAEKSVPPGLPKNILETEVKGATKHLGIPPENLIIYKFEVRKLNYFRQDILEEFIKIRKEINPQLVLSPIPADLHQDHTTAATECLRAFKQVSILGYEIPWNNIIFNAQAFVKLKEPHIVKKVEALKIYKSQSHRHYSTENFIRSLATTRGVQIGSDFAEAFEVIRWII